MTLTLNEPQRFSSPNPEANCLKTGTVADIIRVPEDVLTVNTRTLQWYDSIRPQHYFHCWMVDQICLNSIRIDRNARIERRLRDRVVLHAERFWDDDRKFQAIQLGERLAKTPPIVVNQLRRTPQGCDWMVDRWSRLARIADIHGVWDDPQRSLAFDLLGLRLDERDSETIPLEGLADLARSQVADLLKRKEEVAGLDVLERAMTEADYADAPTDEIRRLRRHDAELHRRLKWFLAQINAKSPYPVTRSCVFDYFQANPVPDVTPEVRPQPPIETPTPEIPVEITPEPEPKAEVDHPPRTPEVRRDPNPQKTRARRKAQRRKPEQPRA
jgi:hypothetical protein